MGKLLLIRQETISSIPTTTWFGRHCECISLFLKVMCNGDITQQRFKRNIPFKTEQCSFVIIKVTTEYYYLVSIVGMLTCWKTNKQDHCSVKEHFSPKHSLLCPA